MALLALGGTAADAPTAPSTTATTTCHTVTVDGLNPDPKPLSAKAKPRPLRIAVLGVLADHKGAGAVTELAELGAPGQFAITLIGKSERAIPPGSGHCLSETGPYVAADLPDLMGSRHESALSVRFVRT